MSASAPVVPDRTTVVVGPRTEYGALLVERLAGRERVLLVARHDADEVALAAATTPDGGVSVVRPEDVGAALAGGEGPVRVVLAAAGPVHPEEPHLAADAAAAVRDVQVAADVLALGRATQVVLVSTVLALAPGDDRRYYGGWKGLIVQQVRHLVDTTPGATLTVLYPGRLAGGPSGRGRRGLHSDRARLVDLTLGADPREHRSQVVGIDARIWLVLRSISIALRSLTGAWGRSTPSSGGSDR